ncbi:lipopolysaccharide heptosyltransferase II [Ferribacterium limneticum]|uniref:lipopolysaccharide heptosyltransferase II n=1 Tax=Ferribacterium limneticum TaxID=76259 RepID=UPI001CF9C2EC|nr:lipopolysaccharide heptosyltransferase II [Ferribacterium limneticum]UCV29350.1 lipopolysaccharide heptosyltransferase II [Ferribacterium limneticum]UCV33269.1 lipopolysaccharide heptosyltransferase II [Ferribacterium limneticum]
MKALIVAPSWIGDTIMAQPLFARLQAKHPGLQLDALAPRWVAPVLQRMDEISDVVDSPFGHGQLSLKARWRLARELAARHYDAVYVLPNSLKSALVPWMAGIPQRIGFTGESRYGLINVRHTLDKQALPLMLERFTQLAERPGASQPKPIPYPRIRSTAADQAKTQAELGLERPARVVAFCPGAEYGPAKRWPATHFATLARQLAEQGCAIWLFGSPKDHAVAEEISQLAPGLCRNLCGATSLAQAVDLLALAELVVCNDSGLMHVAAALDRPIVALYGSSSPGFTPPLSDKADILSLQLDCSPCFKRECPLGHLDCLNKLFPEQVFAACQKWISR